MTVRQPSSRPRWVLPFLAALIAALAILVGNLSPASAAATAETRVGASSVVAEPLVGPPEHIAAGQRLGEAADRVVLTVATGVAVKGGVGPVLKGQAGVKQVEAEIEAAGGKILGREITVEANGVRTRPDLFVEDACGNQCFVEVKNGPTARLTKNQAASFPEIQSKGFIPRGANAAAAGLEPGVNHAPMPVFTVFLGG